MALTTGFHGLAYKELKDDSDSADRGVINSWENEAIHRPARQGSAWCHANYGLESSWGSTILGPRMAHSGLKNQLLVPFETFPPFTPPLQGRRRVRGRANAVPFRISALRHRIRCYEPFLAHETRFLPLTYAKKITGGTAPLNQSH